MTSQANNPVAEMGIARECDRSDDIAAQFCILRADLDHCDSTGVRIASRKLRCLITAAEGNAEAADYACQTLKFFERMASSGLLDAERKYYLPLIDAAQRQVEIGEE